MKYYYRFLFIILVFTACQSFGQVRQGEPAVLIIEFEHQSEAPERHPDYFGNQVKVDESLGILTEWLEKTFKTEIVDHKKKQPISYQSGLSRLSLEAPRSIENTAYDYVVKVQSQLSEKYKGEKYFISLYFDVQIFSKKARRVYRGKCKQRFEIIPHTTIYSEVMVGEEDFWRVYQNTLRCALQINVKELPNTIDQPTDQFYLDFMASAERHDLYQLNRNEFIWRSQSTVDSISVQLNDAYFADKRYKRGADFSKRSKNIEKYKLSSYLNADFPQMSFIQISQYEQELGRFRFQQGVNWRYLQGKFFLDNLNVIWDERIGQGVIKILENDALVAILRRTRQQGNVITKQDYEVFIKRDYPRQYQQHIVRLLGARSLAISLRKFYEISIKP